MFEWLDIKIRSERVRKEGKNKRTRNHKHQSIQIQIALLRLKSPPFHSSEIFLRRGSVYNAVH